MIYALRIYRCVPGRKPALLSRFENETLRIWEKHGIRQAGFWMAATASGRGRHASRPRPLRSSSAADFVTWGNRAPHAGGAPRARIPLDPNTLEQLRGAARSVGLAEADIERTIMPMETTRES